MIKVNKQTQKAVENLAVCPICDSSPKYSGRMTNLTSHIYHLHPSATFKTKVKVQQSPVPIPTPTRTAEVKQKQPTLIGLLNATTKYPFNSTCAITITMAIACFIIDDLRPLSVVEGRGFEYTINALDSHFSVPSRTYILQIH